MKVIIMHFISENSKKQLEDNICKNKKILEASNYLKKLWVFYKIY